MSFDPVGAAGASGPRCIESEHGQSVQDRLPQAVRVAVQQVTAQAGGSRHLGLLGQDRTPRRPQRLGQLAAKPAPPLVLNLPSQSGLQSRHCGGLVATQNKPVLHSVSPAAGSHDWPASELYSFWHASGTSVALQRSPPAQSDCEAHSVPLRHAATIGTSAGTSGSLWSAGGAPGSSTASIVEDSSRSAASVPGRPFSSPPPQDHEPIRSKATQTKRSAYVFRSNRAKSTPSPAPRERVRGEGPYLTLMCSSLS